MIRLLLLLLAIALPARAEEIVADMSQDRIAISTNFDGSEILVFGAVKRDSPQPAAQRLAVIVTVTGPREDVTVRRKERRVGIWVNTDSVEVAGVPSFYAVASSVPLSQALRPEEDEKWGITTARALVATAPEGAPGIDPDFLDALIRVNTAAGIYGSEEQAVDLRDGTLFSAEIELPSDLTEGNYDTRIFLTRDGRIVDSYATSLYVQKVGMERWIYALAHDRPFVYGLLSLFIAVAAGWGASAVFRLINR